MTQHPLPDWEILKCHVNLFCCFFFALCPAPIAIWLATVYLQVLNSFKFATYIVTLTYAYSISMESASLTHFRRQTNKLNDFGLRNFCIIIGVLESMHAKLSCAHTNHILARVPELTVGGRGAQLLL